MTFDGKDPPCMTGKLKEKKTLKHKVYRDYMYEHHATTEVSELISEDKY